MTTASDPAPSPPFTQTREFWILIAYALVLGVFGANPVSWLGQPSTVNYAIIIAYVWASTGFAMVVRRGGWRPALQPAAQGQWPMPRRFLLAGAALGALSGLLMILLGLTSR